MSHAILDECREAGVIYDGNNVRGTLSRLIAHHVQVALAAAGKKDLKSISENRNDSTGKSVIVSKGVYWNYEPAPMGASVFLLTIGGTATTGPWKNNAGYIGWNPFFKRDREKEASLATFDPRGIQ